ncbi:putative ubiquinone biosynthesis monooxygenase [Recurvomyces mirabilis]|nr:putative ubiquinone biosynthesis monooxygenase [Recurvomyces mirabilis]
MSSAVLFKRLLALPPAVRRDFYSTAVSSNKPEIYDVVCVGGGPVGLSFVSALHSHRSTRHLRIALIDSQDLTSPHLDNAGGTFSNRCSSLTPAAVRFMKSIGVWEKIDQSRIQPYHAMDVWDGQQGAGLIDAFAEMLPGNRFQASRRKYEAGEMVVATMCENNNLTGALLKRIEELKHEQSSSTLNMLAKTKVDSIALGAEAADESSPDFSQWPILSTSSGQNFAARLLVGADGANSPVRRFADIPSPGWDYNQHGVVATLNLDRDSTASELRTAYQRFLPTGPVALLPLPGKKASLVWSTSPAHATALKALLPEDFTAAVNAAFRLMPVDISHMLSASSDSTPTSELSWREPATPPTSTGLPTNFPRIQSLQQGSLASFPLRLRHASTYTGHRVALIGDAAHTIHPLAGQGLNLGLADSEALAKQLAYGVEHGMDMGSSWCLDGYNSDRWAKNNAVLGVVDKLEKVYSASSGPVVWGRSAGVEVLERLGWVKGLISGAAAGRG